MSTHRSYVLLYSAVIDTVLLLSSLNSVNTSELYPTVQRNAACRPTCYGENIAISAQTHVCPVHACSSQ